MYDGFHRPKPVPLPDPEPVPVPVPVPVPEPVPEPVLDDGVIGCLAHARSHFKLWNIMNTVPSVGDMGGASGRLHWSKNLSPPDFTSPTVLGEKDKQAFDEMKRLEALYLEKLGEFTA